MNKIRLAAFFLGLILIGVSILGFAAVQIGAASGSQLVYVAPSMTATAAGIEETTTQAANTTAVLGTSVAMTATAEAGGGGGGATATNTPAPTNTPVPFNTATPTRMGIGEATGTPALSSSPTISPTPSALPDTGGGGPNSLGLHIVQSGETLYCLGRAYGVPPQAIAEFNQLAPDAKLLIGQELKIPEVQWSAVPPGPVCTPQLESPYSSVPARTLTPTPIPLLSFSVAHPENLSGPQLINFVSLRGQTKADSGATSFAVKSTPFPAAEIRTVVVNWPSKMLLGASSDVVLTFNPDTGQVVVAPTAPPGTDTNISTHTPEPNRSIVYSQPLSIPAVFDDYSVLAVARIDAVGLSSSPSGEVAYPVSLGESITWRWSIKPLEAEQQKLIISLQLRFTPKKPDNAALNEIQLWNDTFVMNVGKSVFGLTSTQTTTAAGIVGTVGFVSTVYGLWEKIEARLSLKQPPVSAKQATGKKRKKKEAVA